MVRDRNGDRGLANAPRADNGHEAVHRELGANLVDGFSASDHSRKRGGKSSRGCDLAGRLRRRCIMRERCGEAIAAPGNIDNVAGTCGTIVERFSQSGDVEAKAALVHIHVGPDPLNQFSLVDDFAGVLGESDEDIERAAPDVERCAVLLQQPRAGKQPERSKGNGRTLIGLVWHAPLPR